MQLDLDDKRGRFSQEWHVDAPIWVPLPGDARAWPHDVRADGEDTVVVSRQNQPHIRFDTGAHVITGTFSWDSLPQTLPVTNATGLLALSVRGEVQSFPERDDDGRVWLERRSAAQERNRVDISVHRRILDAVTLQMTTRIGLEIAGGRREELLGRPLPDGSIPMGLQSALPVRLEADGRLRVRARGRSMS